MKSARLIEKIEQRRELVQRFNATREEVLGRLHYIEVQREALGFTRHTELHARYRVPPRKAP